ncbi:MAG: PepSY domain-containing protein, partial [Janthinobacterium sp.]
AQLRPSRAMWRMQLAAGAFLMASLPVLNVFTTSSHLGVTLFLGRGPVAVAAFDLVVLVLGLGLAYAAFKLKPLPMKAAKTTPAAKPATTM